MNLGITIVGGHTGSYGGIPYPLNGGCTVWGFADPDDYVTPKGAKIGGRVLITKGTAIEATGILALNYPRTLGREFGDEFVKRAQDMYRQMTVIQDALTAYEAGGVTSMHDATEGGVSRGLYEVVHASEKGMEVYLDRIKVSKEARKICGFFDMDPYISISEGTLVLTIDPERVDGVMTSLSGKGIDSMVVGEVKPMDYGRVIHLPDGSEMPLGFPDEDPFWAAFFRTLEEPDE